ncbi:hypothetical protein [Bradyrhizobium sp. SSUT77]|uniref:hypothetical protein n=1 Tax=Bradyrhizobium sp. SSUT77 TaxID=3040603 RepID=UPI00244760FC|nr:hypothetical protein [Bradyrhizobium sp. SSUT77]MDH2347616.1 hypothetical protein [Bradyrhizobium sp. SSUT77]
MRTIRTIPTLMLAASLGAGMILASEAALARNNGHQDHSDHQEHNGKRSGNVDRSTAPQARHFNESNKKDKGKGKITGTGASGTVIQGDNSPRGAVATTNPPTTGVPITHGGNPPRGPVAGAPGSPAVVSNGKIKLYIPNSASGLTVTSNKSGTVTVSNGDPSHSVTLPGGSVTISGGGVKSVGGAPGVQVVSHPNGDFVAATTGPKKPEAGTVTGGPEGGFISALGSGLKDTAGSLDPRQTFRATVNGPPPETSTTIQQ